MPLARGSAFCGYVPLVLIPTSRTIFPHKYPFLQVQFHAPGARLGLLRLCLSTGSVPGGGGACARQDAQGGNLNVDEMYVQ